MCSVARESSLIPVRWNCPYDLQQQQQQHKSSAAWGEKAVASRLLRRMCAPPSVLLHHAQQLLHPLAALPTAQWIETNSALKRRGGSGGKRRKVIKERWREFFANPSQWWDHRLEKEDTRHPDFTHKETKDALWLDSNANPPWVVMELAAMAPNTVPLSIFSWNVRLAKYVKGGQPHKTMELFQQMQDEGMIPDKFTFVRVLNACARVRALEEGRQIHSQIIQSGCESDVYVANSLIDMYANCGSIEDSWRVFNGLPKRDVVIWNAMIFGLTKCAQAHKALALSEQMRREQVNPDTVTFMGLLNACASVEALEEGRDVEQQIVQYGCESDVFVCNSLVDMYAKCGSIEDARRVFNRMHSRDTVAWSTMILGYMKYGEGHKALELFKQMQWDEVQPDPITFTGVLNACASIVALEEGRRVHEQIIKHGYESVVFVANGLIHMYAKCGSIEDAEKVFNKMSTRDVVSWTAMLHGFAMHGHDKEALEHYELMCEEGVEINSITIVCLLSACSHAGLVDEGLHFFHSMGLVFGITATVEHYACVVDLLGRAGHLQEADDLINTMSCEPNVAVWKALLGACRIHGNVEMGEQIAKHVLELEPRNASGYVLLSNIYAAADK
ncbi:hypothetical protein CY35_09G032400 [Sphagnum magellanicum]|nr:hypothetical protein CY35_09G032400 [Sphagnum magellanicum]